MGSPLLHSLVRWRASAGFAPPLLCRSGELLRFPRAGGRIVIGAVLRPDGVDQGRHARVLNRIHDVHPLLFGGENAGGAQLGQVLRQRGGRDVRRIKVQLSHCARPLHERAQDQQPVFIREKLQKLRNFFGLFLHSFLPSFRFSVCRSPASSSPSGSTHTTSAGGTIPSS